MRAEPSPRFGIRRHRLLAVVVATVMVGLAGPRLPFSSSGTASAAEPFVTTSGTRLILGSKVWYLYGGSTYGTSNPGAPTSIAHEIQLSRDLGLNTLRIVNMIDERGTDPASPYAESDWVRIDNLLAAMHVAGLHAIVDLSTFRNFLHNRELLLQGQAAQAGAYAPPECDQVPALTGYDLTMCVGARWCIANPGSCTDPYSPARASAWDTFLAFVANRINTATGQPYRLDPTIALVAFAGEPNPPRSGEPLKPGTQELTDFYGRVFGQWKSHDPNHLVTSGGLLQIDWEEAFGDPSGSGIDHAAIFALPNQDVLSIHNYFGHFPATIAVDFKTPKVAAAAASVGKPWITEEFGFTQAPTDYSTNPSTTYGEADRGAWYRNVYEIQRHTLVGVPAAGVAFWNVGDEVAGGSHDVNESTPATYDAVRAYSPAIPPEFIGSLSFEHSPGGEVHLLLLFQGLLDSTSIPDAADFSFRIVDPGPGPSPMPTLPPKRPATGVSFLYEGLAYLPEIINRGLTVMRVDLGEAIGPGSEVVLFYAPGTRPIRDLAGNDLAPITGSVGAPLVDVGDPSSLVAFVDDGVGPNHVIVLGLTPFDSVLPPASDFLASANGAPRPVASVVSALPGNGIGILDLRLSSPVGPGDHVTLSYTAGATPLRFVGGAPVGSFTDLDAYVSLPPTPSRLTPAGTNIVVAPADASSGAATTTIRFASVTSPGTTTATTSTSGPVAPAGFTFGTPALYLDLATTATFSSARVCLRYDPARFSAPESSLRLLHYEGGAWVDTTAPGSPDLVNHELCGTTTTFSPFAIAGRLPYSFVGFLSPVDNPPILNSAKAGSAIPIKFKLGGNRGLDIFATGSPSSRAVNCATGSPSGAIDTTPSSGTATLSYDAKSGTYTYTWKTIKTWSGYRILTVAFNDGSTKSALFTFK